MLSIILILGVSAETLKNSNSNTDRTTDKQDKQTEKAEKNLELNKISDENSSHGDTDRYYDFIDDNGNDQYQDTNDDGYTNGKKYRNNNEGLPDLPDNEKQKMFGKNDEAWKNVFPNFEGIIQSKKYIKKENSFHSKLYTMFKMALESDDLINMVNNLKKTDFRKYRRLMNETNIIFSDLLDKFQNPQIAKNPENYQNYNKLSILYMVKRKMAKCLEKYQQENISLQKFGEKALNLKQQAAIYFFDLFKNASGMYYAQHRKDIETQLTQPLSVDLSGNDS